MTLTLAIPAHNDAEPLARLLARAAALASVARVVVVDDGSDAPLEADALRAASGLGDRLSLLRHDRPRGPGAARNAALDRVETDYLLYLDADDLPTRELDPLMADLAGRAFDFCLFQHHDTRLEQELRWGQPTYDQNFWTAAGVALGALSPVPPAAAAYLAQTANYPWNKIYCTAFLREHGIACTEILVHEDVELHWRSFLNAGTILASDRVGVIHFLAHEGDRLTNRDGPERLEVFGPLARIAAEIAAREDSPLALPFARFALGLIGWIEGNLRGEFHAELATRAAAFAADIPAPVRAALKEHDPDLAARYRL